MRVSKSHIERALAASDDPEVAAVSSHAQVFPKESSQLLYALKYAWFTFLLKIIEMFINYEISNLEIAKFQYLFFE